MPAQYIPILIFAVLSAGFPAVTLWLAKMFREPSTSEGAKLEAYESGNRMEGSARGRYPARFYIIAILFVIFDAETIFLFPWAVRFNQMGVYGLEAMLVFLGILIVGYVWLYRKGALNWD
jgi:NADH-quinone oxidoreductase subunit A